MFVTARTTFALATHTTSWNDHSTNYQQYLQEDRPQLHLNIAAATQQQKRGKLDNNITHYIMYSNFKSYHHLLIDSGASTHVCPKDYAPDLPLRPCGESVPQLYTVTNKKIPVYGIKYVPYEQDILRIMIPYYVCDVKYPILSASRLLDRGYGLGFQPETLHYLTWTTTSTAYSTLRTFLPTSRKDQHTYRTRHLPNFNDYRQWKIHCCNPAYA